MSNAKKPTVMSDDSNFKNFFDHISDLLFVIDYNGNILDANKAVTTTLGYSKQELIGLPVLILHPPESGDEVKAVIEQMIAGQTEYCSIPLISKTGCRLPVETRISQGIWNTQEVLFGVSRNLSDIVLSKDMFHAVFNNSQMMMAISEIETGRIINVNRRFLTTLGYHAQEVIGKKSTDIHLFPSGIPRIKYLKRIKEGGTIENEYTIVTKRNGEQLYCQVSVSKIQIQTHSYLLTSANDITLLKKAEQQLHHGLIQQTLLADISQTLNSTDRITETLDEILLLLGIHTDVSRVYIFEDSPCGTTTSNTFEWCNKGVAQQKDDLQEIPYDLIPSWKKILVEQGKVFATNIYELPEDIIQILEPQEIKSILVFPLYVQGRFFGFIGFDECVNSKSWQHDEIELLRAISNIIATAFERYRYQTQVKESEAQLKMAIENTETGLWDWNIKTGSVFFNDIWCQMLEYQKEEIDPNVSSWKRLVHPEDLPMVTSVLNKHLSGETDFYQTAHRLLTKSGRWKWVIDKGRIIEYDSEGSPLRAIGMHIDIDIQKKIEEELRIANATKDKFFSIIGHDLRGPIGAIMQISELISEKGNVDEDTLFDFLKDQKQLSKNTFQLLENLLYWARYNSNGIVSKPSKISINRIIEEHIALFQYDYVKKNLSLSQTYTSQYFAWADENMVKLIVRNLLSNAIKFTPSTGMITIAISTSDHAVTISITNTGHGIEKENIAKILSSDEFYTSYGTDREKGTGLGLKLCKSFVELNNGVFSIESNLNQSSTVSFTLPVYT